MGRRIRLLLTAEDGANGSGPAFVRVGDHRPADEDGQLATAPRYPAVATITFDALDAHARSTTCRCPCRTPRATPSPRAVRPPSPPPGSPPPGRGSPDAEASPDARGITGRAEHRPHAAPGVALTQRQAIADPTPEPADRAGRRVLRVQWRDVAGNWSEPMYHPRLGPARRPSRGHAHAGAIGDPLRGAAVRTGRVPLVASRPAAGSGAVREPGRVAPRAAGPGWCCGAGQPWAAGTLRSTRKCDRPNAWSGVCSAA